ncbi:MAG: SRPBCC domain-containing protein [Anaerolineales bacterium]|nr:SRPBCC domain-containing protein [Anaerolineales bacterium]
MQPIVKDTLIQAPPQAVWAALTDPAAIRSWMGDDSLVEVDLRPGGRYRLFGGETTGAIQTLEPAKLLSYTWRQGEWPAEWEDSLVDWRLTPAEGGTQLHLVHDDFPNQHERDSHDEGWDLYFLQPMKDWLEGRA